MTDWLLALVPQYGLWLLVGVTFLSCLALPIPASILMLTAGGFAAAGDFDLWQALGASGCGAILGDQLGYGLGRGIGPSVLTRLGKDQSRDRLLARAQALMDRNGAAAVFLSRWLLSPLGPYVNLIAGSTGLGWLRFTLAAIAGEALWTGMYIGAGFAFGGNIQAANDMLGSLLGLIGGVAAVLVLGFWLFGTGKQDGLH